MPVDLEQLSAKQLFDLANRKLQLEQQAAQRAEVAARAEELRKKQQQFVAEHEKALGVLDREYAALKQRRDQIIAEHQARLAGLEQELAVISRPVEQPPSAVAAPAANPASSGTQASVPAPTLPPRATTEEDMVSAVLEALRGRNDISDSLLREKLRVRGLPLGNLGKLLEKMVRDGSISNKGGGNYSLKKKS